MRRGRKVNFGMVSLGKAEVMLNPQVNVAWFYTDQVDAIYLRPKWRDVAFGQHIDDMFCSARQCSIHDPDGYELYFIQAG